MQIHGNYSEAINEDSQHSTTAHTLARVTPASNLPHVRMDYKSA